MVGDGNGGVPRQLSVDSMENIVGIWVCNSFMRDMEGYSNG